MCGRFYVPEDSEIAMLRKVMENLESRNVTVKTGEVSPGDVAAVIANNRELKPQPFGMLWGYHLPNGKLLFNARSETAAQKSIFADGIEHRRCVIPASHYFEWQKTSNRKTKYAMEQQEKLTVLLIEPERYPKTIEIEPGLEPLQKAVGGWIEAVYPWEDKAAIIVNEEGKLDQLPLNRALRTEEGEIYDITAGNMLIVGLGEEDFSSLTKDQLAHYEKLFHQPETFIRLGGHLMAIPIPDKEVRQAENARKQDAAKKSPSHDAR